ncbi:MAG: PTS glucose transporter subunit IIA [Erysipelotrichaceae bacterium]|nr:PTS glucose transporter subunit IIA [Erysipelotrichaceae bacterium]
MGLFDYFTKRRLLKGIEKLNIGDDAIVAPVEGEMIDVSTLPDPMFAEKMLGDSIAIRVLNDDCVICSPANGVIRAIFPTGHAFGIETNEGVEILVHCGINTVEARGEGFTLLDKKLGDKVSAGEPIVIMNNKKLQEKYDTSIILIITNPNEKTIEFIADQNVNRGTSLLK